MKTTTYIYTSSCEVVATQQDRSEYNRSVMVDSAWGRLSPVVLLLVLCGFLWQIS